jgi:amino acid adenylation domain-containing protein
MLPVRSAIVGDPTFADYLASMKKIVLNTYEHQNYTYGSLLQKLKLVRDPSRAPLVAATFNIDRAGFKGLDFFGLEVEVATNPKASVNFDVDFNVLDTDGGLLLDCEYNTDLFDASTVRRWLGHFKTLLEGIVACPEERISQLPLVGAAEREQLLFGWNDTGADYPQTSTLQSLFEAQVERTPDRIALVAGDRRLTYRELNERANRVAHRLRALGVGSEVLVGVLVERSAEMLVGLLGILKAGGAYVPLDPAYPQERVRFMLEDAAARVLLTQESLKSDFAGGEARVLLIDTEWEEISRESAENPPALATAENLAYVIYTSGSTGRPKGVAIEHKSAATLIHWSREHFDEAQLAGVLASTSICFDLSVFELFMTLSWGGKVILAENALQLPTLTAVQEVTLINTVPSAITELVRAGVVPASVTTVCLAGEPLQNALVQQIYQHPHVRKVYNLYGPTEDTTYSTWALMEKGTDRAVTIGRPIANTQVYILDQAMQPVPTGVAGELYLGGGGLARGYLDRPELTAERFVPNPFSTEPGARMYRTGDLARYRADGMIEYLGRIDHQVKVRGFRVELGEIEAALGRHAAVRDSVVVAREDVPGQKRLVAYLVPEQRQTPTSNELRQHLAERLPEYMVPSLFVMLDALPLTPNGKVDRKALPVPDVETSSAERNFVAPRTPHEKVLADVWSKVLHLDEVGIHDNIFELGGDSLLIFQISTRANQAGLRLTPRQIFQHRTIAELSKVVVVCEDDDDATPQATTIIPVAREAHRRRRASL